MGDHPPTRRLRVINVLIFTLIGVLVVRLWQIQVLQGSQYLRLSEENRIRDYTVAAPRGLVYDRKGRPLVTNRPSFTVAVLPLELRQPGQTLARLARIIGAPAAEIDAKIQLQRDRPFEPVRVMRDASQRIVTMIEENRLDLPGVIILAEPVRQYLRGIVGAHLLGYVGEISEDELLGRRGQGYKPGDLIGKTGVERAYESLLRGVDGRLRMEVDALGRPLRVLARVAPVPGRSVVLTIDLDVQQAAYEALRASGQPQGAVVAMDPRSGELLALESIPSYDPNLFATGITQKNWQRLITDPQRPLLDRAIGAAFEPGSIFKLVTAAAALEEGIVDRGSTFYAPGYFRLGRWVFRDLRAWGTVSFITGIANSINVVFYTLGYRLGGETLAAYARRMGLGGRTGIDLPGEVTGTLPSPSTKLRLVGEPWYPGDSVNMAIGQGAVTVTPVQAARMVASIANGGTLLQPRLLKLVYQRNHTKAPSQITVQAQDLYRPKTLVVLHEGMRAVVERGTGGGIALPTVHVSGKTGSAETPRGKPHAWFAAFAPSEAPRVVVVAFIAHGSRGGIAAAPVAKRVLEAVFGLPAAEEPP